MVPAVGLQLEPQLTFISDLLADLRSVSVGGASVAVYQ